MTILESGHRNCHGFIERPSVVKTALQRADRYFANGGPISNCPCLSIERQFAVGTFVTTLFFLCRPFAIVRRIRSIILHTVNTMRGRRSGSHVAVKSNKAFAPMDDHLDASRPIVFVTLRTRIMAAIACHFPNGIFWTGGQPMSGNSFQTQASATRCIPASHGMRRYARRITTIASAFPCAVYTDMAVKLNNGQASESFTSQIYRLSHAFDYTLVFMNEQRRICLSK